MTFTLEVDAARWRAGLDAVIEREPRTVPVLKGNGYGFGNARLAAEAVRLGSDTIAVGTVHDLAGIRAAGGPTPYAADTLILTPWHPSYEGGDRTLGTSEGPDQHLIRTLAHPEAILELAQRNPAHAS